MGVPLADTVAIGDSDNDLTMIDAVDASGLAHAFERLGVV